MRATLHLLVLLTILYFVHGSPTGLPIPFGVQPFGLNGRIVNGTEAVPKQFPHQVSLMRSWSLKHFCGGNVISPSLVLTAGHCMYLSDGTVMQPWMLLVVGGVVKLNDRNATRQERGVANIRLHPEFDLENLYNDVAVLQLSEPFTFTPEINSVHLPGYPPVPNTICQVAGWGYHSSNIPIVFPDLMYVDLPIRSQNECRKLLENITDLPSGMFCAGYLEGGKDACNGDSGGGMTCNGVLTGVVSGGQGCAEPLLPGVYSDVFHYLDWILKGTDVVVVVVERQNINNLKGNTGNYGALNTSAIMAVISFLLCAIINYT